MTKIIFIISSIFGLSVHANVNYCTLKSMKAPIGLELKKSLLIAISGKFQIDENSFIAEFYNQDYPIEGSYVPMKVTFVTKAGNTMQMFNYMEDGEGELFTSMNVEAYKEIVRNNEGVPIAQFCVVKALKVYRGSPIKLYNLTAGVVLKNIILSEAISREEMPLE